MPPRLTELKYHQIFWLHQTISKRLRHWIALDDDDDDDDDDNDKRQATLRTRNHSFSFDPDGINFTPWMCRGTVYLQLQPTAWKIQTLPTEKNLNLT